MPMALPAAMSKRITRRCLRRLARGRRVSLRRLARGRRVSLRRLARGRRGHPLWAAIVVALVMPAAAQEQGGSGFQPAEISIGEPLALPFGSAAATPAAAAGAADPSARGQMATDQPANVGLPGSGWLGFSLAESNAPGRWQVDQISPGSPAARAGVLPGDEVRAVNGVPLAGGEELSAVLAAIASGQLVRIAVARDDEVRDLVLQADPRPVAQPAAREQPAAAAPFSGIRPTTPEPGTTPPASPAASPWVTAPPRIQPPATPVEPLDRASTPPLSGSPNSGRAAWNEDRNPERRFEPAVGADAAASVPGGRIALGVRTLPIDSTIQSRFKLVEPAGAYVLGVVQDLPASRAGVPPGSVIVSLDGRPVRSPGELTNLVTAGPLDRPVTLQFVLPGGESRRASVELQSLTAPVVQALVGPQATGSIPVLEPGPRRAERPMSASPTETEAIREELRVLRDRLERLERRLQPVEPTLRR